LLAGVHPPDPSFLKENPMATDIGHGPSAPQAASSAAPLRSRPSWSGLLRLSLVSVPIKAFPVVSSSADSHFHLLHAACGQRIRYEKRCPLHGAVDASAIVRGYAYAPDHHVVMEPEELDRLRPAKDKALLLEHFLPAYQIDPSCFAGRSLYLLPDGLAAEHPYSVMAEALHQSSTWAIGRVVLSSHRNLVVVRPAGRLLLLDVLHYPAQVRPAPHGAGSLRAGLATAEELRLARQLIDAASGPLDWSRYRDTTAEELAALVQAKVAQQPLPAAADESGTMLQLLDALKQSVVATRPSRNGAGEAPASSRTGRKARGTRS
jgi:DNA end-binding protein Ku